MRAAAVVIAAMIACACGGDGAGEPMTWGLSLDCPPMSWSVGWQPTEQHGVLSWDCVGTESGEPLGPFAEARADGVPVRFGAFDLDGQPCGVWIDAVADKTRCFERGLESGGADGVLPEMDCLPCDYANPGGSWGER